MKKGIFFLTVASACMLTGCSDLRGVSEGLVENYVIRHSQIVDNADYQEAQKLQSEGVLNADGEYDFPDKEENQVEESKEQKQVCVTIADNSFLEIGYFYDSGLTEEIGGEHLRISESRRKTVLFPAGEQQRIQ